MSDGREQRRALGAAEEALRLLGIGDGPGASRAAEQAARLDRVGAFVDLPAAVGRAALDLATGGGIRPVTRALLLEAVGAGPLRALIGEVAGSSTDGPEVTSDGTKVPM